MCGLGAAIVGPSSAAVTVSLHRAGVGPRPPLSWASALRASAAVLSWRRHVVGQASHSQWARAAVEVALESCPLTPSPAPHLRSHRDWTRRETLSKNFLDSVDLTVPFGSASNLQSSNGSHRPWVKSWLPGLALKDSYSLVPGSPSAFLPPAPPVYGQKAAHNFLCESCWFLPPTLLPTSLPCRTPTQPLSPS